MKVLGAVLVAVGLVWALIAFNMSTEVTAGGERLGIGAYSIETPRVKVNNIGLMEQRRNHLMMASVTILAGIMLFGFGSIQRKGTETAEGIAFRVCPHCAEHVKPDAKVCRFCQRDIPSVVAEAENKLEQAKDRGASEAELRELAEKLKPKGQCPNCDAVIDFAALECPKCRASFGPGSSWAVRQLPSGG